MLVKKEDVIIYHQEETKNMLTKVTVVDVTKILKCKKTCCDGRFFWVIVIKIDTR